MYYYYKSHPILVYRLLEGAGKKKSKARASGSSGDPIARILTLLLATGFANTTLGESVNFADKTPEQQYNFIKRAFNTKITKESISNPLQHRRPFLVINMHEYRPVPGFPAAGHTLIMLQLDDGSYGTIGFYPKSYASGALGLMSSFFGGSPGILASADPISRKLIKGSEILNHVGVAYNGYLSPHQAKTLSRHLESMSDERKGIQHYRDDDMGNYHPLAMGNTENCLTWLNSHLGLELTAPFNIPNKITDQLPGREPEMPFIPIQHVALPSAPIALPGAI